MVQAKYLSVHLSPPVVTELQRIAATERRSRAEVARLLLMVGLRAYRRGRPLLCGYPDCTRANCCGGTSCKRGKVVEFPRPRNYDHH